MPPQDQPSKIDRYEVIDVVGRGGMGVVYQARDPKLGRLVAIKLLNLDDDSLLARFLQEARLAGQLKHRNIVTIYDFGELDKVPFIVMEFVEGTTLATLIRQPPPLSLARKLELGSELAAGLDYAHNRGVIHRDVKPANVMVDREGVVKILDFGLARTGGDAGLTQHGLMMGTPNYMSPEQIQGQPIDRRSDIFAVGLVFYELLSGKQAFSGGVPQVLYAITQSEPEPLSTVCPDLDPAIVAIVDRAIEKDANHRYQTLAALNADIGRVRARLASGAATDEWDNTIVIRTDVRTPLSGTPTPRAPRSAPLDQLARRRGEAIDAHLERARRAFESGDYLAAVDAAEQAALLDPADQRVLDVLESARERVEQRQVEEWLTEADRCLVGQDLDGASGLVAKALELDPASSAALRMQSTIGRTRRQVEHDRDAVAAVESARRQFEVGEHAAALSLLDQFSPPHSLVGRARAELTAQMLELERRKQEDERQRRGNVVSRALADAERYLGTHKYDQALRALAEAEAVDGANARVTEMRARILGARETAWTRTKSLKQLLDRGTQALVASDWDEAIRCANEALAIEAEHADARGLKARASEAKDKARRSVSTSPPPHVPVAPPPVAVVPALGGIQDSRPEGWRSRRTATYAGIGAAGAIVLGAWLLRPEQSVDRSTRLLTTAPSTAAATSSPPTTVPPSARLETPVSVPQTTSVQGPPPVGTSGARRDQSVSTLGPDRRRPTTIATTSIARQEVQAPPRLPPTVTSIPLSSVATTSIPPATSAPPTTSTPVTTSSLPSVDRGTIDRILTAYADAMRRLDLSAVQRVYPTAPGSLRVRIDALRKNFSQCDTKFSNLQVVSSSATDVVIRVDSVEACKPKTAQPAIQTPGRHEFHLARGAAGDWVIGDLFTQ